MSFICLIPDFLSVTFGWCYMECKTGQNIQIQEFGVLMTALSLPLFPVHWNMEAFHILQNKIQTTFKYCKNGLFSPKFSPSFFFFLHMFILISNLSLMCWQTERPCSRSQRKNWTENPFWSVLRSISFMLENAAQWHCSVWGRSQGSTCRGKLAETSRNCRLKVQRSRGSQSTGAAWQLTCDFIQDNTGMTLHIYWNDQTE